MREPQLTWNLSNVPTATCSLSPSNSLLPKVSTLMLMVSQGGRVDGYHLAPQMASFGSLGRPPKSDLKCSQPVMPQCGGQHLCPPRQQWWWWGRVECTSLTWLLRRSGSCRGLLALLRRQTFLQCGNQEMSDGEMDLQMIQNSAICWCLSGLSKVNNCQSHQQVEPLSCLIDKLNRKMRCGCYSRFHGFVSGGEAGNPCSKVT